MRGRRLVTTERLVAIASESGREIVDDLQKWVDDNGLHLDWVPVGTDIDDLIEEEGRTIGVTLGGDGTFLEGINRFAPHGVPLVGIDAGTSAFLVRHDPEDLAGVLTEVVRGQAMLEMRSQLHVEADGTSATGLNDVVVEHVKPERPVDRKITTFDVYFDKEYVGRFPGSGLAVATPTGSTGLALSAGGPIHFPKNNQALQLTPLHTHRLGVRPVVIDNRVTIRIDPADPVELSVDGGRTHRVLDPSEVVCVSIADEPVEIIHTSYAADYFSALGERLGWGVYPDEPPRDPPEGVTPKPMTDRLERARQVAIEAAKSVGGPLRQLHGKTESIEYKTDKADIVTEADYRSEQIITTTIENEFPGHNILSEETVHHDGGSIYTWVIDPLDGTGNYANGNPNYSVSIGLLRHDKPVMGVVYAPETDELFTAIENEPAYRDGNQISTTDRDQLDESVFMSGYDPDGTFLSHFYDVTRGVRRLGSVALHLCYLASGSCDATWEYDTYPWDTAAGVVIARSAGARITDAAGEEFSIYGSDEDERNELIGTNGPLHDSVLNHLQKNDELRQL